MHGSRECRGGLVVARGNGLVLLEAGKEVFDQVPCLVQMPVVVTLDLAGAQPRGDHRLAHLQQWPHDPIMNIVDLVGNERMSRITRQQGIRTFEGDGLS